MPFEYPWRVTFEDVMAVDFGASTLDGDGCRAPPSLEDLQDVSDVLPVSGTAYYESEKATQSAYHNLREAREAEEAVREALKAVCKLEGKEVADARKALVRALVCVETVQSHAMEGFNCAETATHWVRRVIAWLQEAYFVSMHLISFTNMLN
jgi:hypothetical protein